MTNKTIILVAFWLIYIITDYFYLPYFVQPITWLLVSLILLILLIRQIIKSIKERGILKTNRILNLTITLSIFLLTIYNFNKIPSKIIEKIDWTIFYNKRVQIVNDILSGKIKPNTKTNNGLYELPFDFPIISNGGNDIWIYETKTENVKTIKFWISRGFFDSPQTYFIFTNDIEAKKQYEEQINTRPEYNWKLEENWYRIIERY